MRNAPSGMKNSWICPLLGKFWEVSLWGALCNLFIVLREIPARFHPLSAARGSSLQGEGSGRGKKEEFRRREFRRWERGVQEAGKTKLGAEDGGCLSLAWFLVSPMAAAAAGDDFLALWTRRGGQELPAFSPYPVTPGLGVWAGIHGLCWQLESERRRAAFPFPKRKWGFGVAIVAFLFPKRK